MRTTVFIRGCPPEVRVHVFTKDPRLTDDAFCRARDKSPDVAVQIYQKDVRIEGLAVMLWLAVFRGSAIELDAIEEKWFGHVADDSSPESKAIRRVMRDVFSGASIDDVDPQWREALRQAYRAGSSALRQAFRACGRVWQPETSADGEIDYAAEMRLAAGSKQIPDEVRERMRKDRETAEAKLREDLADIGEVPEGSREDASALLEVGLRKHGLAQGEIS